MITVRSEIVTKLEKCLPSSACVVIYVEHYKLILHKARECLDCEFNSLINLKVQELKSFNKNIYLFEFFEFHDIFT